MARIVYQTLRQRTQRTEWRVSKDNYFAAPVPVKRPLSYKLAAPFARFAWNWLIRHKFILPSEIRTCFEECFASKLDTTDFPSAVLDAIRMQLDRGSEPSRIIMSPKTWGERLRDLDTELRFDVMVQYDPPQPGTVYPSRFGEPNRPRRRAFVHGVHDPDTGVKLAGAKFLGLHVLILPELQDGFVVF